MKTKLFALAITFTFLGCATDTGDPAVDRRGRITNAIGKEIFNAALNWAMTSGINAMTGQNGQDAAAGVFEAAKLQVGSGSLERIATAYAGPEVGNKAAELLTQANPKTPEERGFFSNVIGAGLQFAANQLTK